MREALPALGGCEDLGLDGEHGTVHRSGLDVLGLWGLMATIAAYMSLFDVGFSDLIVRTVAASVGGDGLRRAVRRGVE